MRILFDARPSRSPTGIGRYAAVVGDLLRSGLPGHDAFLLDQDHLRARTSLEEELELPAFLAREEIDVFHSPLFHLPAILPAASVVTLHDAIPAVRPDLCAPDFARLFEGALDAVARADAVVCPSEHAKADVVRCLGVAASKVRVVPEAPAPCFRVVDAEARRTVRARFGLESAFLLVVGSIEARKNPTAVLEALARVGDARAVFVGPAAGFDLMGEAKRRGVEGRVRSLGRVSDEDLVALYNEALALVFPSLYEGFGLPIVEAFACGTPVIASRAASIPEVAGNAAILVDPEDAAALAEATRTVSENVALRDDLRTRGRERLRLFSPDRVRAGFAALYSHLSEMRA